MKTITKIVIICMVVSVFPFSESTSANYYTSVNFVVSKGLMVGAGDGNFMPKGTFTNEELMVVMSRLYGEESHAKYFYYFSGFKDVPNSHWASRIIGWAEFKGLTMGDGTGRFGLGEHIDTTRLSVFLLRYLGYSIDGSNADFLFSQAFSEASKRGVFTGIPAAAGMKLTREEVARILHNLMEIRFKGSNERVGTRLGYVEYSNEVVLTITPSSYSLRADGHTWDNVTIELKDSRGMYIEDTGIEVSLITTHGLFFPRRIVLDKGKGVAEYNTPNYYYDREVEIGAIITGATNSELLGLEAIATIRLERNTEPEPPKVGASIVGLGTTSCAYIDVYLNMDIEEVSDLLLPNRKIDPQKLIINIKRSATNMNEGTAVSHLTLQPLPDSKQCFRVILDTDNEQFLFDNSNVWVQLVDYRGDSPRISQIYKAVTDNTKPYVMSVKTINSNTLEVAFSEPVYHSGFDHLVSATRVGNYVLNGVSLTDPHYMPTISVGQYDLSQNKDSRNIVTIKFENFGFVNGQLYSLQVANVGDFASISDSSNRMLTQTIDFRASY